MTSRWKTDPPRIVLGSDHENPSRLTCFDWHSESMPSNQQMVRDAPESNGYWEVEIERAGSYEFTLRQQPTEAEFLLPAVSARLSIGAADETKAVPRGVTGVTFRTELKAGPARLQTWLTEAGGKARGAFYVYAKRLA